MLKVPVDNFTWFVLEYASEIYKEDEDFFLNKSYNPAKVEVGNDLHLLNQNLLKKCGNY